MLPGRSLMDYVYDPINNKYLAPAQAIRNFNTPEYYKNNTPYTRIVAIVDTGVLPDHPFIKNLLIESIDFTGEGIADLNGHGTIVTLLAILPTTPIINVKVVSADGKGSPESLINGLNWLKRKKKTFGENIKLYVNVSLGTYSKKWGIFDCRGRCRICKAAEELTQEDVTIYAAAGNTPGKTSCPAKLALTTKNERILAVGDENWEKSGKFNRSANSNPGPFRDINW